MRKYNLLVVYSTDRWEDGNLIDETSVKHLGDIEIPYEVFKKGEILKYLYDEYGFEQGSIIDVYDIYTQLY